MDLRLQERGAETALGAIDCARAAGEAWERRLNANYHAILNGLDTTAGGKLGKAQRAWTSFRDHACGVWRDVFREPDLGESFVSNRRRDITARRAIDLEVIRDALGW